MDRERMQKSETEQAKDVPFSSSMTEDNLPSNDPYANNGADDDRSGSGPERRVSKNCGVETPVDNGYPLPVDPHAPHGTDGDNDLHGIQELGVDESKDVGHNASVNQYGLKP